MCNQCPDFAVVRVEIGCAPSAFAVDVGRIKTDAETDFLALPVMEFHAHSARLSAIATQNSEKPEASPLEPVASRDAQQPSSQTIFPGPSPIRSC